MEVAQEDKLIRIRAQVAEVLHRHGFDPDRLEMLRDFGAGARRRECRDARLDQVEAGKASLTPGDEVFANARRRLG
jgi:hypothetical protein